MVIDVQGHSKWITSLAWEPTHLRLPARRFVSGGQDKSLRVWDAVTLQCLLSMSSHSLAVSCVRWGGEGLLYSASKDTTINVWESQVLRLHPLRQPSPSLSQQVCVLRDCMGDLKIPRT